MEKMPENKIESKEKGENVKIVLKFIRHGERTIEGFLTDRGREATRQKANESNIKKNDFDAVKAIGSTAGPKGPTHMGRALETSDSYAHGIAGDEAFNTKKSEILNYETFVNPAPYNLETYESKFPDNFEQLSEKEKAVVIKKVHTEILENVFSSDVQREKDYVKEIAGSFAYIIDHYSKMAKRLNSNSRVLIPAGTHGGIMEAILKKALVRKLEDNTEIRGFKKLEEIGGIFDTSEAFNINIKTDDKGNPELLKVSFDNPKRPVEKEMYLDSGKVKELSKYYAELHKLKFSRN